jgi:hypothetical protein
MATWLRYSQWKIDVMCDVIGNCDNNTVNLKKAHGNKCDV